MILALRALRLGLAGGAADADDPALAIDVLGRRFANPIGLAAGFDKNAVAVRGADAAGLRLRRDRHGHAAAAARQSAAAPVPPGAGPRGHQPAWASTTPAWTPICVELAALADRRGAAGRQCRHQQGGRRSGARLPRADRRRRAASPTTPSSTSPRPTRPGCATCRARRSCARSCAPSRAGAEPAAGAGEDRARPVAMTALAARGRDLRGRGRSGPDRRQHHHRPAAGPALAARAAKPAACPARRCSRLSTAVLARAFLLARGRLTLIGAGGVSTGATR